MTSASPGGDSLVPETPVAVTPARGLFMPKAPEARPAEAPLDDLQFEALARSKGLCDVARATRHKLRRIQAAIQRLRLVGIE